MALAVGSSLACPDPSAAGAVVRDRPRRFRRRVCGEPVKRPSPDPLETATRWERTTSVPCSASRPPHHPSLTRVALPGPRSPTPASHAARTRQRASCTSSTAPPTQRPPVPRPRSRSLPIPNSVSLRPGCRTHGLLLLALLAVRPHRQARDRARVLWLRTPRQLAPARPPLGCGRTDGPAEAVSVVVPGRRGGG